jgi:hypothetical protein
MTLRHMTRVKIIKTLDRNLNHCLYIIPIDMVDSFNLYNKTGQDEEEFNRLFSDYRFSHIDEAELYIKKSNLYP